MNYKVFAFRGTSLTINFISRRRAINMKSKRMAKIFVAVATMVTMFIPASLTLMADETVYVSLPLSSDTPTHSISNVVSYSISSVMYATVRTYYAIAPVTVTFLQDIDVTLSGTALSMDGVMTLSETWSGRGYPIMPMIGNVNWRWGEGLSLTTGEYQQFGYAYRGEERVQAAVVPAGSTVVLSYGLYSISVGPYAATSFRINVIDAATAEELSNAEELSSAEPTDSPTSPTVEQPPLTTTPSPPSLTLTFRSDTSPSSARTLRFVIDSTTFTDNGQNRTLEAAPFIANDRTMVPLRVIGEALGAENLAFDSGVITFTIDGQSFRMVVGEALPGNMGAPVIIAGRTFVPLAFIVNEMGATARWDGTARAAYIYID